jgi:initiation factor 2B subunit 1/2 family protein
MHPIERLRHVARAEGAGPSVLVREAAGALAGFGSDPQAIVTACRRLVDGHPAIGPMWWLAAHVLTADEPVAAAWRAADELEADTTATRLAAELPDDATVVVLGRSDLAAEALRRRADLEVLVVDAAGDAAGLARRLRGAGIDALEVPDSGIGAAVVEADLVLLEVVALGHDGFIAVAGSRAAAAVAHHAGTPVWAVAGVGRALPDRLWDALVDRIGGAETEPWDRVEELVPLDLADDVIGLTAPTCPVAPELLKPLD